MKREQEKKRKIRKGGKEKKRKRGKEEKRKRDVPGKEGIFH